MDELLAALRLQLEWGVDEVLDTAPVDRLTPPVPRAPAVERAPRAPAGTGSVGVGASVGVPHGSVVDAPRTGDRPADRAVALAGAAVDLAALREALAGCELCPLRDTATHLVFAEGDPAARTLIIGEPPGRDEDRSGHPFAGADGALLDQMLASIGLRREVLMLTPLLPWRPPGGRPPSALELAVCLPFLHRLIVLLGPRRLVLFGGTAAKALLPTPLARRRAVPEWLDAGIPGLQETLPVLYLPALAELQKTPPLRRGAWAGLRLLRRAIDRE